MKLGKNFKLISTLFALMFVFAHTSASAANCPSGAGCKTMPDGACKCSPGGKKG